MPVLWVRWKISDFRSGSVMGFIGTRESREKNLYLMWGLSRSGLVWHVVAPIGIGLARELR